MHFSLWFTIAGLLLILAALTGTLAHRYQLTSAVVYLAFGVLMSPLGLGELHPWPAVDPLLLERLTEVVVIISLFTAGLKLRVGLGDHDWWVPIRLAFISMALTVGLIACLAMALLGLPLGVAILLGAILAPTDPVLAGDVQVEDGHDRDQLRFGLTGEAGLNDGTAFPFVLLGLGLLDVHPLGEWGWRWVTLDFLWGVVGGLAIGGLFGMGMARFIFILRRHRKEEVGFDDFLALGLVGVTYGVAVYAETYGFLAVFAAGLALRRTEEMAASVSVPPPRIQETSIEVQPEEVDIPLPEKPTYMATTVLNFNKQLERIGEVTVVILIGAIIYQVDLSGSVILFAGLLFLIARPIAVWLGLLGTPLTRLQRGLIGWFGVRGVGSLYYLSFALTHGLKSAGEYSEKVVSVTLFCVALSIVVHGISAQPLLHFYRQSLEAMPRKIG